MKYRKKIIVTVIFVLIACMPSITSGYTRYHSYDELFSYTQVYANHYGGGFSIEKYTDNTDNLKYYGYSMLEDMPEQLDNGVHVYILTDNRSIQRFGLDKISILTTTNEYVSRDFNNRGDYEDSFLIFVSHGFSNRVLDLMMITDIWQNKHTIYIRSQFVDTMEPALEKPYPMLKYATALVKRDDLTHYGQIRFVVLDEYGKELTATRAWISPTMPEAVP